MPNLLLPLAHLDGAGDLPRALFAWEVLGSGGCVVASARAERAGEELGIEEVEQLGEPLQTTVDRRGVDEALLRTNDGMPVLLRRRTGSFRVLVAATGSEAGPRAESLADELRVEPGPRDTRVAVAFWSGSSGDPLSGIGPRWRRLALPTFAEIRDNYPTAVQKSLADLFSRTSGDSLPGRVTTNEPLGKLHPAALRPCRAMATLEFGPLSASEARAWLAERGLQHPISSPKTIAELHAILAGAAVAQSPTPSPVGFG